MSQVTLQGQPIEIQGRFPQVGEPVADFSLAGIGFAPVNLSDFVGKKVVLNIFPSVDTPICAMSVRMFNQQAASKENTAVICISADLPFAASRFCAAEGIENVTMASFFRAPNFTQSYGVKIAEGPMAGLAARAVICLDETGKVSHCELVSEIKTEPDYDAALAVL
ncbi:thiol peroxidase [Photobacterium damselae]